jgi:hypothetical protein
MNLKTKGIQKSASFSPEGYEDVAGRKRRLGRVFVHFLSTLQVHIDKRFVWRRMPRLGCRQNADLLHDGGQVVVVDAA